MFDYIPFSLQNVFDGTRHPGAVKNDAAAFLFWCRSLYQRLCSTIEFTGLPDEWERARDLLEATLFYKGFAAVFYDDRFGLSFQPANLYGYDFYYQPTQAIVSNPKLSKTFTIGEDCELIKLTNDFKGVCDIVAYYAEKLATLDGAVNMAIINSKLAYVFGAKNKGAAQAVKMIFDKINAGEPTVVYDTQLTESLGDDQPFEFLDRQSLKNSYITTDLLADAETIINDFNREIGIPTLPEKRERMITNEAEALTADSSARITLWDECLRNSLNKVNSKFGTNISFKFRFLEDQKEASEDPEDAELERRLRSWVTQS